jgi:secreted trypsin-like serine protease
MRRPALLVAAFLSLGAPAAALVGGANLVRESGAGRHIVMIVSTRGNFCTGTLLARDLVLTAGHCVAPSATYRVLTPGMTPPGQAIGSIRVHPRYKASVYAAGRVTADVALIKLNEPLPDEFVPAALAAARVIAPGDRFVVAGYGFVRRDSDEGAGVQRTAALIATGRPGNLQLRLVDPSTRGARAGLGACTGDSGAPAFVESEGRFEVIGVVSWSTGPSASDGCGGMTGVTPLALHRAWIIDTARKLGSAVGL